jgi:hypothetical protein
MTPSATVQIRDNKAVQRALEREKETQRKRALLAEAEALKREELRRKAAKAAAAADASRVLKAARAARKSAAVQRTAALGYLTVFGSQNIVSPWQLDQNTVVRRLEALVRNPSLIHQGDANLCGPAVFFRLWIERDALAFVTYAHGLFRNGRGKIGNIEVVPRNDLVKLDYSTVWSDPAVDQSAVDQCPMADWMTMSALRRSERDWLPYVAKPVKKSAGAEELLALTTDGEIDHYILLRTRLEAAQQNVRFSYWSWGTNTPRRTLPEEDFRSNYYGAIIAKVKPG